MTEYAKLSPPHLGCEWWVTIEEGDEPMRAWDVPGARWDDVFIFLPIHIYQAEMRPEQRRPRATWRSAPDGGFISSSGFASGTKMPDR